MCVRKYEKKKDSPLYQAIMEVVVRANWEHMEEERKMCDALRELFAEDFLASREEGMKLAQVLVQAGRLAEFNEAVENQTYRAKLFEEYQIG